MADSKVPKLRELRKAANMTQKDVGKLIGGEGRVVYTYESGIATPSLDSLAIWADYFGVTIDYIMGRRPDSINTTRTYEAESFGRRIGELRAESHLSKKELAEKAQITPSYLNMIESGKKNPTMPVVVQLLNALRVSADTAFSDCVIGACETKAFLVQQKLSTLTKEEQFVILRLIDSAIESIKKAPSIFAVSTSKKENNNRRKHGAPTDKN